MSSATSRVWLGNGLVLLALAGVVGWLGGLHDGTWWSAPTPQRWQLAALGLALYLGLCTAVLLRARTRVGAQRADASGVLIVWASQTGFARELAQRSVAALRSAGVGAHALPIEAVDRDQLVRVPRLLCIVSTTGEGDAPDHAQSAERSWLADDAQDLTAVQYAVLALGDRGYAHFCAFPDASTIGCRRAAPRACSSASRSITPTRTHCSTGKAVWRNWRPHSRRSRTGACRPTPPGSYASASTSIPAARAHRFTGCAWCHAMARCRTGAQAISRRLHRVTRRTRWSPGCSATNAMARSTSTAAPCATGSAARNFPSMPMPLSVSMWVPVPVPMQKQKPEAKVAQVWVRIQRRLQA